MLTVLLHGFWGGPADWNAVLNRLPLGVEVWTPDLYEPGGLAPHHDIAGWCGHFCEEIIDRAGGRPVQVVGYSMGGRLLLNAVARDSKLCARALILSAQPFRLADDNGERARWELNWRQKFLANSWPDLETEWNALEVFSGSTVRPARRKSPIMREMLGQSLVNWSPRLQNLGPEQIRALPSTVDWAFGAIDQKYLKVAQDLANLPVEGQISIIENAGHRLLFDAAAQVAQWIQQGS